MPSSFRFKTLLAEETIIFWASTGQLCKHQNQVPDKSAIVEAWDGGYFGNFWVGMCRWDPGTLNIYQS